MKTITFNSNYSAFAYRMTAEIADWPPLPFIDETSSPEEKAAFELQKMQQEATQLLCLEGVANICYRTAGSNVDKALGVKSKKNGGMGRDGLSYDPALGETINAAVSAKITELEASTPAIKAWKLSFAVTGEHVKGETASSKEAETLWAQVQVLPSEQFAKAMTKLGFVKDEDGDFDYDDASGIAACQRHIQEEKRQAALKRAASLGM